MTITIDNLPLVITSIVGILGLIWAIVQFVSTRERGFGKLDESIEWLKKSMEKINNTLNSIENYLLKNTKYESLTTSSSPKEITPKGHEILNKCSIKEFLANCELVQNANKYKGVEGLDIFIKCLEWVKKNSERKIAEIKYNSNASLDDCQELLALAIRDEILTKTGGSP